MNKQLSTFPDIKISEHSTSMLIQIDAPPVVFQRPVTTDPVFQNVTMMTFQQLTMKKARAALRSKSLSIISNPVSVEITITSLILSQSVVLERTLKAIFDGLNKNVIKDDTLISHAQVWFKKGSQRYPKPIIEVEIRDLSNGDNLFFRLISPMIEKVNPIVYGIGGAIDYDPQFVNQLTMLKQSFASQNYTPNKQYEICHMLFYVSDLSKDVDNMFLAYIDLLRSNGYLETSNNIGIGMYKRNAEIGQERTIINLVAK